MSKKKEHFISSYSTEYLMLIHIGDNTYKCPHCNNERKIVKRGYGRFIHQELKKYRDGFGRMLYEADK